MIRSMTVTNYLNESIDIVLDSPEKSGLIVTNITGIGAGNASINISEIATRDGGFFNSARKGTRNIVISLKFMETNADSQFLTIEDVRHRTYQYFPVKRKVTLTFTTDTRTMMIDGYVESNEPDIFNQEEATQISILCPFPWFREIGEQYTYPSHDIGLFTFPFSNELVPIDLVTDSTLIDRSIPNYTFSVNEIQYNLQCSDGMIFGDTDEYTLFAEIGYNGTIGTGFEMIIEFNENLVDDPYGGTDNKAGYLMIRDARYTNKKMVIDLDKIKRILPRCSKILAGPDPDNPGNPEDIWYLLHTNNESYLTGDGHSAHIRLTEIFPEEICQQTFNFDNLRMSVTTRHQNGFFGEGYILSIVFRLWTDTTYTKVEKTYKVTMEITRKDAVTSDVILSMEDMSPFFSNPEKSTIRLDVKNSGGWDGGSAPIYITCLTFRLYGEQKDNHFSTIRSVVPILNPLETGLSDTVPIAQKGDILRISTKIGNRGIWYKKPNYEYNSEYTGYGETFMYWGRYENGRLVGYMNEEFNILGSINKDVEWFQIEPGYNLLSVRHTFHPETEKVLDEDKDLIHIDYLEIAITNDILDEGV